MEKDNELLLRKAYEKLKIELSQPENQYIERSAVQLLDELSQEVLNWNINDTISIFDKYWTATRANDISKEGTAKIFRSEFNNIFLKDQDVQNKIQSLILLRLQEPLDYRLISKIANVKLIEQLNRIPFENGRPLFYVHRLEIMIFPQLFTTIADRNKLDKTAKLLGIKSDKVAFERVQYQIREKVNDFIHNERLSQESEFIKSAIAWWLLEVGNN
ncbi:hypothetical protein SAMN05720606_102374 [Paenibacillus polysaccharolyticus]|uniref:Uncharacterized protein n=2 Tax=Paenibacillus TaxID=44249 RepID=A0A1G5D7U8_9BACL|nr:MULTISPECIES: hypothetical protein [Paenibacillus]MBY0205048.1 hypothetical protein [Paenibacillus cucumis (ex Kampfer et al. 2016)]SCY10755.1 hypothetical protein SAMN05720606_102374 [Paenibacillus polysaccharolyticus]